MDGTSLGEWLIPASISVVLLVSPEMNGFYGLNSAQGHDTTKTPALFSERE